MTRFTGTIAKSRPFLFATKVFCSGLFISSGLFTASTFAQSAHSGEPGPYGYARVSAGHLRIDDAASNTPSANIKTIGLRGGFMFLPMAGLELRANTTAAEQTWDGTGTELGGDAKLDYSAAALIRVQANLDPGIAPYLVVGGGTSKVSYTTTSPAVTSGSLTQTGFVGALGLDLQFKNRITLGAEVGQFAPDSLSFGVHAGFDF